MSDGLFRWRNLILLIILASVVVLFLVDMSVRSATTLIGINYLLIAAYYGSIIAEHIRMKNKMNIMFLVMLSISIASFAFGIYQIIS